MLYKSTKASESSPKTQGLVMGRDVLSMHYLIAYSDCSFNCIYLSRSQQARPPQLIKHFLDKDNLGHGVNYSRINVEDVVLEAVPFLNDCKRWTTQIRFGYRIRSGSSLLARPHPLSARAIRGRRYSSFDLYLLHLLQLGGDAKRIDLSDAR